jgi:hypothetical protein
MLTKVALQILVSILNTFFSPMNTKDRDKFILIKLINSFAMIMVLGFSTANLMYLKEILFGEHTPIFNSKIEILYYIYLSLLILVSCIIALLGLLLFLRRHRARRIFIVIFPALIILNEIKHYFIALEKTDVDSELFALFFVSWSSIMWLGVYLFILLKSTKKYYESA